MISRWLYIRPSNCLSGTIITRTNGNANDTLDDLTIHNTARENTWADVNTCIFHVGTLLTYSSDGWYLTGIVNSRNLINKIRILFFFFVFKKWVFFSHSFTNLSKNWMPTIDETPMYKKIPNSTAIGIKRNNGAIVTDMPTNNDTTRPETRCSFTSTMCGLSPGAWVLEWNDFH